MEPMKPKSQYQIAKERKAIREEKIKQQEAAWEKQRQDPAWQAQQAAREKGIARGRFKEAAFRHGMQSSFADFVGGKVRDERLLQQGDKYQTPATEVGKKAAEEFVQKLPEQGKLPISEDEIWDDIIERLGPDKVSNIIALSKWPRDGWEQGDYADMQAFQDLIDEYRDKTPGKTDPGLVKRLDRKFGA